MLDYDVTLFREHHYLSFLLTELSPGNLSIVSSANSAWEPVGWAQCTCNVNVNHQNLSARHNGRIGETSLFTAQFV